MTPTPHCGKLLALSALALLAPCVAPAGTAAERPAAPAALTLTMEITPGVSLVNPPLSDRKLDGALGAQLAGVADAITLLEPGTTNYTPLRKDDQGRWVTEAGRPYTNDLEDGHGFLLTRQATNGATLTFSGSPAPRTCVIREGRNIIGLGQNGAVALHAPFQQPVSGSPAASFDETKADEIDFLNPDGSWHRYFRTPDELWFDVKSFGPATNRIFRPGEACYYMRQPGHGPLIVKF